MLKLLTDKLPLPVLSLILIYFHYRVELLYLRFLIIQYTTEYSCFFFLYDLTEYFYYILT
jgi:hypothetical protein